MPKRKPRRVQLTTLLVVGEGASETAFVKYMKSLFCSRSSGKRITVQSGDGGSPMDLVKETINKSRHIGYEKRYVFLDEDIPISQQVRDKARRAKIELIVSSPICLEGMLLDVLGESVPVVDSGACKARLHPMLSGPFTSKASYASLFSKELLEQTTNVAIVTLRTLIK